MFWAWCFERLFGKQRRAYALPTLIAESATTSALAYVVDYTITPKRLTPGYELRLSGKALVVVYAAFAAELAPWQHYPVDQAAP